MSFIGYYLVKLVKKFEFSEVYIFDGLASKDEAK